jgi:hypothetical protein
MSVAKVVEITASSPESFEAAVQTGLARATETLDDVRGAWINEMNVTLENGKIKEYRVNMRVTFVMK